MLMPSTFRLRLAELAVTTTVAVALFASWRADRRDRAQLAAELAATKQLLMAADARQHDRDAQLAQTLAALAAEKRTILTPAQIVRDLPNQIHLPAPIVLQASPAGSPSANPASATQSPGSAQPSPGKVGPAQTDAVIPAVDLKPLYEFTLDCKACQAKLAAAQGDFNDEKTKTDALTRERDQALQIARGGSAWRRIRRAAKWFLLGAAAGAVAAKARH
jgi:hypothetical protein